MVDPFELKKLQGQCVVNPLLTKISNVMSLIDGDEEAPWPEETLAKTLTEALNYLPERYYRPEASWRRMMLTQPPVDSSFYLEYLDRLNTSHSKVYTHGDLYMNGIIITLDASINKSKGKPDLVTILRRAAPMLYGTGFESTGGEGRRMARRMALEKKEQLDRQKKKLRARELIRLL